MLFFSFLLLFPMSSHSQKKYKVVLDAGHGGKDPGNLGNGFKEKYIALKVVQAVARELRNLNDIDVVLTRDKDVFIELHNRAKIANDEKADLFVSIHCDAFHRSDPHGAGTFVLGLRGNQGNFEIAKRENAVILLEDDYKQNYDYDPNSPESVIGLSVLQEENLDESLTLAGLIQNNFVEVKRYDRSVKQDNFLVLRETVMPSVLIELGFLTNKAEGKFLNSKDGQIKMAKSIAKAIEKYIKNLKLNTVQKVVEEVSVVKEASENNKQEVEKANQELTKQDNEKTVATVVKVPKIVTTPYLEFKVQVAASKKFIPTEPYNFKGLKNIEMKMIDEYYKYYYGSSSDFEGIKEALKEVKQAGHKGAFVVAFQDGVKIPLNQALKKQ
ncbi:N-acetylmuramoyl-L-alanine amidase [Tenacibaculum adriaticum]|uniref:N-acetylmuramoyl-L-alanine amidase n=2 Tax=Tenacibaculum adriaticum TaxID=413713 RepID=A0A5S5DQ95_9FLAO|nr:N-acetylmuramoyl-L-alanine amidase [Tenacibaculum adriaticum]